MSSDQQNGGGAFRRFSGFGNNAPQDFRAWKKWAKAKAVVEKSNGLPSVAAGPMPYTLLDGDASDSLDHIDIDQLAVDESWCSSRRWRLDTLRRKLQTE